MDWGFIFRTVYALAVVGLLLLGFWWVVRSLGRGRLIISAERRLVTVIESTPLTQNTALHVVKIGDRYFAVGGGAGHLSLLTELSAETVEPWMEGHRRALGSQAQSLSALLARLRRPPA